MKSIKTDLRSKTLTQAPPGASDEFKIIPGGMKGLTGQLPMPVGTPVSNIKLTDYEKEVLKAAGWKEGEPIPPNMPKIITASRKHAMDESQTELPASPDTPAFQPPKLVAFEDLPAEKQIEMTEAVKSFGKNMYDKTIKFGKTKTDSVDEAPIVTNDPNTIEVVDTRKQVTGNESLHGDNNADHPANCPHCGWPVNTPDVAATDEDKYAFIQSILGQIRFTKKYKLFGGKLSVEFRSITSTESDMVFRQMALDSKNGKIDTTADYYFYLMNYRLSCSLAKIESTELGNVKLPEISEYLVDQPVADGKVVDTPLVKIFDHITETVLPQESVRRIVVNQLARFQRLIEHLEVRVDDEDFWNATEAQP